MNIKKLFFLQLMMTVLNKAETSEATESPEMFDDFNGTEFPKLKSYMLVTPVGIDQAKNLTNVEQESIKYTPLMISPDFNYVQIDASEEIADKLIGAKFVNKNLPSLSEISSNDQTICRVKINGYVVLAIGSIKDESVIQAATGVGVIESGPVPHLFSMNNFVTAAKPRPIKLYDLGNPRFFGSEILAYNYAGNIGPLALERALDSFEVVSAFADVLKMAKIRSSTKTSVVYTGDRTNDLVANLIENVNKTTMVFSKLDTALEYIRKDFFHEKFPDLMLDKNLCPIGQQSKINKMELVPKKCSQKFPIHGITKGIKDYGVKFSVQTNRKFSIDMSTIREDGTIAKFNITFKANGLLIQADKDNNDIISSNGPIRTNRSLPVSMMFEYNGFINTKGYDVQIIAEECKFGIESKTMDINVRKKGEPVFKNIGYFSVHGQPLFAKFCGFSPVKPGADGIKNAHTELRNIESTYINKGLRTTKKQNPHKMLRQGT